MVCNHNRDFPSALLTPPCSARLFIQKDQLNSPCERACLKCHTPTDFNDIWNRPQTTVTYISLLKHINWRNQRGALPYLDMQNDQIPPALLGNNNFSTAQVTHVVLQSTAISKWSILKQGTCSVNYEQTPAVFRRSRSHECTYLGQILPE